MAMFFSIACSVWGFVMLFTDVEVTARQACALSLFAMAQAIIGTYRPRE